MTGGRAIVPVCGLTPAATSHFQATTFSGSSQIDLSGDLTFATGAFPSDIPPLTVMSGASTSTYLGLGLTWTAPDGSQPSVSMIVDSHGKVLWYHRAQGSNASFYLESPTPGRFILWNGPTQQTLDTGPTNQAQYIEEDLAGDVLQSWYDTYPRFVATGMDMAVTPTGNAALVGYSMLTGVTVPYGGVTYSNQSVLSESIDAVQPDGGVAFHWESWPTIQPDRLYEWSPGNVFGLHANSLDQFPDGSFLLSLHNGSAVLKIVQLPGNPSQGTIFWTLGGTASNFQFKDDPNGQFGGQHDVRVLPDGDILMMDNGFGGTATPAPTSRAAEYKLDETAMTATLVWSFDAPNNGMSGDMGSARRLANSNTLVDFGTLGQVYEVDLADNIIFAMNAPAMENGAPVFIYRAVPIASLY